MVQRQQHIPCARGQIKDTLVRAFRQVRRQPIAPNYILPTRKQVVQEIVSPGDAIEHLPDHSPRRFIGPAIGVHASGGVGLFSQMGHLYRARLPSGGPGCCRADTTRHEDSTGSTL